MYKEAPEKSRTTLDRPSDLERIFSKDSNTPPTEFGGGGGDNGNGGRGKGGSGDGGDGGGNDRNDNSNKKNNGDSNNKRITAD
jgi:hypothetical protein